jgi:hypothetical protein
MPKKLSQASPEAIADYFVNFLFAEYSDSRHVRRVASWVGLIVLGIEKLAGSRYVPRSRQLRFEYDGKSYKAKFNHKAGPRGGIDIVEIGTGRGSPEVRTVHSIPNLQGAADFYDNPAQYVP